MLERILLIIAAVFVVLMLLFAVSVPPDKVDVDEVSQEPPQDEWFQQNAIASDIPVLLDFKAEWCGPCRLLHPELVKLEQTFAGRMKVLEIDIDRQQHLSQHYQVSSIPMVLIMKEGQIVDGFLGFHEYDELVKIVEPHLPEEVVSTTEAVSDQPEEAEPETTVVN